MGKGRGRKDGSFLFVAWPLPLPLGGLQLQCG
jgi:hypothetical protein